MQMPQATYERPNWVSDELNAAIYASGLDRISKADLKKMILSCGKSTNPGANDPTQIPEGEVDQLLNDFFAYNDYTENANLRIFIFQYTRMELFKTIRFLRSQYGNDLPVRQLCQALMGAAGRYQGDKMANHLCPDQFADTVALEKVAEFYFSYEAMLTKDATEGGVLCAFDIPKELLQAVEDNHAQQVKMLLTHPKGDPNAKDGNGSALLHIAVEAQYVEVYTVLLANGADPNILNRHGNTALHVALDDGNMDLLQELITAGCDVNMKSFDGQTALHLAVSVSNDFAVRALLQGKADPMLADSDGNTALALAKEEDDAEIVKLLDTPAAEEAKEEAKEEAQEVAA